MESEDILIEMENILQGLEEELQGIVNRKDKIELGQEKIDKEELKKLEDRQEELEAQIDELVEDKEKFEKIVLESERIEQIIEGHHDRINELQKIEDEQEKKKEMGKLKRAITMNLGRLAKKKIQEGKILERYQLLNEAEKQLQEILAKYPDNTNEIIREYRETLELNEEERRKILELQENIENEEEPLQEERIDEAEEKIIPEDENIIENEEESMPEPEEEINTDGTESTPEEGKIVLDDEDTNTDGSKYIDDSVQAIEIDEQTGNVMFLNKKGKTRNKDLEGILYLKNRMYERIGIKTICEEIAGGRLKGALLLRKLNPAVVDVLSTNGAYLRKYIECMHSNSSEGLPFKLSHNRTKSKLGFIDKIRMRRYARFENKIPGINVIYDSKTSNALEERSSMREFLPEENTTEFESRIKFNATESQMNNKDMNDFHNNDEDEISR